MARAARAPLVAGADGNGLADASSRSMLRGVALRSRGPNVSRLTRRGKVDDLRAALRYGDDGPGGDPAAAAAVRADAARALARFDGAAVGGDLALALSDPDARVRLAAMGSLETVGLHDSAQVDHLIWAVVARGDHAADLAASALKLLVASVPEGSVELLVDRLLHPAAPAPDEGHRASLDLLLTTDGRGQAARDSVVELLLGRLQQRAGDGSDARAEVVLGWLGPAARERVLHALENGMASAAVMRLAGRLGDARAIGPVVKGLEDSDAEMREAAAHAARALNHTRAVPALLAATQDDQQAVRDAASAALDRMGTAAVIAGLAAVVDAQALLERPPEGAVTGEVLGERVAQALGEGAAQPADEEPADEEPADAEPADAEPADAEPAEEPAAEEPDPEPEPVAEATAATEQSPRPSAEPRPAPQPRPGHGRPRRGGLVDRLFGRREP